MILGYKGLLNRTKAISHQLTKTNLIYTITEILETIMIRQTGDSSWFNRPIINLPIYTMLIIEVSFPNDFWPFSTAIKNNIKQLPNKEGSKYKFERFFEKTYKIMAAIAIPRLFKLIHNDLFLDLTWMEFCKHSWLENPKNSFL